MKSINFNAFLGSYIIESIVLLITFSSFTFASHSRTSAFDNRFIVKFDREKIKSIGGFSRQLHSQGIGHEIVRDYTRLSPRTFYGASVRLHDSDQAKALRELEAVLGVTPVSVVRPVDPIGMTLVDRPLRSSKNPESYAPHVQTRISDLHAMGYFGQGVKVALIDSGVDCSHPALGGGFGPGHKISFGHDLVGDEYDSHGAPQPKKSPCTPCATHGTHTLGIVGAADVGFGFQGVVPNATLGMYRVIGCNSEAGTSNDVIVSAVLMAIKDGAHVISASIGGVGGWSKGDALSDLVNNIFAQGVTLILAAGNEGNEGLFFAESPSAATHSISVGSVESLTERAALLSTSAGRSVNFFTSATFNGTQLKVYPTSNNSTSAGDACQPLPASAPNLTSYVVLTRRGDCTFAVKAKHIAAKGGKQLLIYMNSEERVTIESQIDGVAVAGITARDGEWMSEQARSNPNFRLTFVPGKFNFTSTPRGGFVSNFSQYGPTYDFKNMAPNFLAVGGQIVSTIPVSKGNFSSMSGTSMSTPQLAGIAALVKSIRGLNFPPHKLRNILSTTAQQVFAQPGSTAIETVTHQGGGLVDAYCAAFANTSLSVPWLTLSDLRHFKAVQTFEIINEGSTTFTFRTGHIPADTVPTFAPGGHLVLPHVKPLRDSPHATVEVSPSAFTLQAGKRQTITAKFTPPQGIDQSLLAVYSGYVSFTSDSECETHTLPYYGVLGVMKDRMIIDRGPDTGDFVNITQPRLTNEERKPINGNSFHFRGSNAVVLRHRFAFGTKYSRVDVVPGDAKIGGNRRPLNDDSKSKQPMIDFGRNFTLPTKTFRGVKIIGMVPDSNVTYTSRTGKEDTIIDSWEGSVFAPGSSRGLTRVPDGSYKLLIRALRIFGNPLDDYDYDFWLSPTVKVDRSKSKNDGMLPV